MARVSTLIHQVFPSFYLFLILIFPLLLVIYYLFLLLLRISLVSVNFARITMCLLSFTYHFVLLNHKFLNLFCLKDVWEVISISSLNFLLLCSSAIFLQMFVKGFVQSLVVNTVTSDSDFQFVPSNKAVVDKNVVNTATSSATSFATWHCRLGHPSVIAMKIVFRLFNIPNINKEPTDFCNHYCIGKSHRLASYLSHTIYAKPFDLVFTDLCGFATSPSSSSFRYYVTSVDANTGFT